MHELSEGRKSSARLIPAAIPPHRPPAIASGRDRARMAQLAITAVPGLHVDCFELRQQHTQQPSYTLETLRHFRREIPPHQPMCLVLGSDQLAHLKNWHRIDKFSDLTHLAILPRPHTSEDMLLEGGAWQGRRVKSAVDLHKTPNGLLFVLKTTPLIDISATAIRAELAAGRQPDNLPQPVIAYIREHGLYGWAEKSTV